MLSCFLNRIPRRLQGGVSVKAGIVGRACCALVIDQVSVSDRYRELKYTSSREER
jgi:hypothetical protein